jgi:hypothetical protein
MHEDETRTEGEENVEVEVEVTEDGEQKYEGGEIPRTHPSESVDPVDPVEN